MRPLIGHDPARLLVPSALTGAVLLLAADVAVRIIPSTTDIKVAFSLRSSACRSSFI